MVININELRCSIKKNDVTIIVSGIEGSKKRLIYDFLRTENYYVKYISFLKKYNLKAYISKYDPDVPTVFFVDDVMFSKTNMFQSVLKEIRALEGKIIFLVKDMNSALLNSMSFESCKIFKIQFDV